MKTPFPFLSDAFTLKRAMTREDSTRRSLLRVGLVTLLVISAVSLLSVRNLDLDTKRPAHHALREADTPPPPVYSVESLLELGDLVLQTPANVYPDSIYEVDWSTLVPRRDILHLGALQRACVDHPDAIISWRHNANSTAGIENPSIDTLSTGGDDERLLSRLRDCAAVDIYMPQNIRGQGYCEDASAYTKYLHARMLPNWVFERTFFDKTNNKNTTYHQLCPKTPLLFFNHYWDGIRDRRDWPVTKPLYLMPNIEMYELNDYHYLQADVILCKTAVCATYLSKWFEQEGNPRMAEVLYTRFTTSDVATNALVSVGVEEADDEWRERYKNFDNVVFTHTVGTSFWKGTRKVLDCWTARPDLPLLNLYVDKEWYDRWCKHEYGVRIGASANIKLHTAKMDSVTFGRMLADSAFFLCPSEMEGYGHYINHARATGGLIITSDAPPMSELVTHSSGVVMNTTRGSHDDQFLGGVSNLDGALRNVDGYVASFSGDSVCNAVDVVLQDLDRDERRRRAQRARQQYFFDTAFFMDRMARLRQTLGQRDE